MGRFVQIEEENFVSKAVWFVLDDVASQFSTFGVFFNGCINRVQRGPWSIVLSIYVLNEKGEARKDLIRLSRASTVFLAPYWSFSADWVITIQFTSLLRKVYACYAWASIMSCLTLRKASWFLKSNWNQQFSSISLVLDEFGILFNFWVVLSTKESTKLVFVSSCKLIQMFFDCIGLVCNQSVMIVLLRFLTCVFMYSHIKNLPLNRVFGKSPSLSAVWSIYFRLF